MKISANLAKRYMWSFHENQKKQDPESIYATYLIFGTLKGPFDYLEDEESDVEESANIMLDPYSADSVHNETMMLIGEHELEDCITMDYRTVHAIQVYSLGPYPLTDLRLITRPAEQVAGIAKMSEFSQLGIIRNLKVRKRKHSRKMVQRAVPVVTTAVTAPAKPNPTIGKGVGQNPKPTEPIKKASASAISATAAVSPSTSAPSMTKKGGIMSAFAKAKPKEKRLIQAPLSDDGEDDDEPIPPASREASKEIKGIKQDALALRKLRQEREAALKKMMEEDDEDVEEEAKEESEDDVMEDLEPEPEPETKSASKEENEVVTRKSDGRRRGRRRVTHKKQVMDDEGYLGKLSFTPKLNLPHFLTPMMWAHFMISELNINMENTNLFREMQSYHP